MSSITVRMKKSNSLAIESLTNLVAGGFGSWGAGVSWVGCGGWIGGWAASWGDACWVGSAASLLA